MSRIGTSPIPLPAGVNVTIADNAVTIKGPRGEMSQNYDGRLKVVIEDGVLSVQRLMDGKMEKALHGLTRSLLANMVHGVTTGFEKKLELHSSQGDVYRVQKQGQNIVLQLGYSHTIEVQPKPGVEFRVDTPPRTGTSMVSGLLSVLGNNKEDVGQQAAEIRSLRPPEPYKGKGIRYAGEYVRRKAGKAGGKGAKGKK